MNNLVKILTFRASIPLLEPLDFKPLKLVIKVSANAFNCLTSENVPLAYGQVKKTINI